MTRDEALQRINDFVNAGEPDKAIEVFDKAHLGDTEDPGTLLLLANLYLATGRLDDAKATLEHVVKIDPKNADALYDLSLVAEGEGDAARQETLLKQVVAIAPDNAPAQAALGEIYLGHSNVDGAEMAFQKSLATDPANLVALVGLGDVYSQKQKLDEAEQVLDRAVKAAPDYPFAYVDRGKVRADNGDYSGAEKDLSKAIELEPDYVWHYIDRGRIRARMGHSDDAIADFTKAISISSDNFMSFVYRGQVYQGKGDVAPALADYEKALSMRPDYYPIYGETGALEFMSDKFVDAGDMFAKAFDAEHKDYSYPLIAVISYRLGGDEKRAKDYLTKVVDALPHDSLFYSMGRYLLTPGNDGGIFRNVNDEKDKLLKAKMMFLLGSEYYLQKKHDLAQSVLLEVGQQGYPTLLEARLADWLVHSGPNLDK